MDTKEIRERLSDCVDAIAEAKRAQDSASLDTMAAFHELCKDGYWKAVRAYVIGTLGDQKPRRMTKDQTNTIHPFILQEVQAFGSTYNSCDSEGFKTLASAWLRWVYITDDDPSTPWINGDHFRQFKSGKSGKSGKTDESGKSGKSDKTDDESGSKINESAFQDKRLFACLAAFGNFDRTLNQEQRDALCDALEETYTEYASIATANEEEDAKAKVKANTKAKANTTRKANTKAKANTTRKANTKAKANTLAEAESRSKAEAA